VIHNFYDAPGLRLYGQGVFYELRAALKPFFVARCVGFGDLLTFLAADWGSLLFAGMTLGLMPDLEKNFPDAVVMYLRGWAASMRVSPPVGVPITAYWAWLYKQDKFMQTKNAILFLFMMMVGYLARKDYSDEAIGHVFPPSFAPLGMQSLFNMLGYLFSEYLQGEAAKNAIKSGLGATDFSGIFKHDPGRWKTHVTLVMWESYGLMNMSFGILMGLAYGNDFVVE